MQCSGFGSQSPNIEHIHKLNTEDILSHLNGRRQRIQCRSIYFSPFNIDFNNRDLVFLDTGQQDNTPTVQHKRERMNILQGVAH